MRSGKLLTEGRPGELMDKYNCTNLEDVFLLLSRKQQEGEDSTEIPPVTYASESLSDDSSIDSEEVFSREGFCFAVRLPFPAIEWDGLSANFETGPWHAYQYLS